MATSRFFCLLQFYRKKGESFLNELFTIKLEHCARGMYCISVSGDLPEAIKRTLREKNIQYRSRDVSQKS